ncbi:sirohydrochlorin chelatase [Staphylococcus durrellii]|uniref:sirohydrochlorin chelatase n=1 Tax=Staphylococcus durrellii TaxID=2781773 RepID=UPI00189D31D8|nr:sirohydrochlorin chelatase [Staphylococcus durrellii]MBF7016094.1 sirohydrochlorin chelatase [Staphylococcus durrellii]
MRGILYVSHGSRIAEATAEAIQFIEDVKRRVNVPLQEICFLELAEPTVAQGIETLVKKGATEISVIPVLLLSAGHYFKDIPAELEKVKTTLPEVTFTYGQPLGVQSQLTNILKERIEETNVIPNDDAKILVVGRGSYNPQTKIDIEAIASDLGDITGFKDIDVCYLAACKPSFEDALTSALDSEYSQIFIVPYIWFTGVLEKHIRKTVDDSKVHGDIILCDHLGNHEAMKEALKDRVNETLVAAPQQ